ncbi:cytochrome P450 [Lactarius psammicola]|nr:cytochrome P450 [Lactarius psammicola]
MQSRPPLQLPTVMQLISWITAVDYLAASLFLYLFIVFRDHRRRRGLPYPPGPSPLPVIGNILDVPKRSAWVAYRAMSKKYGDIVCLHVFGQVVVVLSSLPAIKDLLEKRGEKYADRPMLPIQEIMELDWLLPTTRMSEYWRGGRRLLDRSLGPGATASYRRMIEDNTRMFLGRLLEAPEDFFDHIGLLQGRLIMSLTYGYDLKDKNDRLIAAPVQTGELLSRVVLPGAVLVNHLPLLRYIPSWVPWFNYEAMTQKGRELSSRMANDPFNFVKNAMKDGTAVHSLASEHIREIENLAAPERQKQEVIVKKSLASMYAAGSDTTVSSLSSLFLALVLYPEVQKRAQAELDTVIARDRLPTFDDRPRLPYIDALCRELLRWQMVTPMGVPHASTEDDVYNGLFIPKGAIMVANAWAILHNPDLYPDPEAFKPERFINEDRTLRDDPVISMAFGVGKRVCPGRHFVDSTIFIVASSVLSVFDVMKAKDENGREIPVNVSTSFQSSVVVHPGTFKCSILPRDKSAKDLIVACLD